MPGKAKVLILRTAGTNCDEETAFAFKAAGGEAGFVHINQLLNKEKNLRDYHILALPGGFSYGDDITAGRILGNELRLKLGKDIKQFIDDGKLIIGICNGFQVLVKSGILPGPDFLQTTTLMLNDSAKFEDRWIYLKSSGKSVWTQGINKVMALPVAHGEGKFVAQNNRALENLKNNGQVIFRYCSASGRPVPYPGNPNGATDDIAGISDETGRVLGLMPHPERHFFALQHPQWTRSDKKEELGDGARIFQNGIDYVQKNLL